MTETEARAVLLLRAFEAAGAVPADDAAWAGREARRQLGDAAAPEAWLAQRARLGLARLAERDAPLRPALAWAQRPPGAWALLALTGLAALLGMVGESLGAQRHINLLALPLLGLLAWNAVVYGVLIVRGLLGRAAATSSAPSSGTASSGTALRSAGTRLYRGAMQRVHGGADAAGPAAQALQRFGVDWSSVGATLRAARGAAALHAAAAALALGAVASMYARGLVFDYQAGWNSTFLQPDQVRQWLGALLGPASAVAGLPLPDAAALAGLRLSAGGGEGAAPWIHRWALTLLAAVVLPRTLLAGVAFWRARRLAGQVVLPDDESLRQLLHGAGGVVVATRVVRVLPYSYQLDAARQAALGPALQAWLGPGLQCEVRPTLPLGAEDDLTTWLPAALRPVETAVPPPGTSAPAELLVLLFALTATPERETHGALVAALTQALAAWPAPRPLLRVAVDESGFRQRLGGPDGVQRLAQRRAAWEALLIGQGVVPGFVDLSASVRADTS
jgi:hypothetical protein